MKNLDMRHEDMNVRADGDDVKSRTIWMHLGALCRVLQVRTAKS